MNSNFEDILKSRLENHEVQAPDIMGKIHAKRTGFYVFRNKLILNKRAILGAAALLLLLTTGVHQYTKMNSTNERSGPEMVESTSQPKTGINSEASQQNQSFMPSEEVEANQHVDVHADENSLNQHQTTNNSGLNSGLNSNTPSVAENNTGSLSDMNQTVETGQNNNDGNSQLVITDFTKESANHQDVVDDNTNNIGAQTTDNENINGVESKNFEKTIPVIAENESENVVDEINEVIDNSSGEKEITLPEKSARTKWSVSLSGGPSMADRNLVGNNNSLHQLRDQSEKQLISAMANLHVNYALTPHIEAYSGFNYFNRREQLKFNRITRSVREDITWKDVVQYDPLLPPQTVRIYDTTYTTIENQEQIDQTNHYRRVSIPMGLRYSLYANNKLGFNISADIAFIVDSRFKGAILREDQTELDVSSPQFRRDDRFGSSLSFAAGCSYLIDPRLTAIAELRRTKFQTPSNVSSYGLDQYDHGLGLLIGLKYQF